MGNKKKRWICLPCLLFACCDRFDHHYCIKYRITNDVTVNSLWHQVFLVVTQQKTVNLIHGELQQSSIVGFSHENQHISLEYSVSNLAMGCSGRKTNL